MTEEIKTAEQEQPQEAAEATQEKQRGKEPFRSALQAA